MKASSSEEDGLPTEDSMADQVANHVGSGCVPVVFVTMTRMIANTMMMIPSENIPARAHFLFNNQHYFHVENLTKAAHCRGVIFTFHKRWIGNAMTT